MKKASGDSAATTRELTQHILGLTDKIYRSLEPGMPHEGMSRWLSSDLTIAQLRVMLLLYTEAPLRMSAIAEHLHIALSTATGVLDKLVAKGMVLREAAAEDRRLVICKLSTQGQQIMGGLWDVGRAQIARMLHGLTAEQLKQAAQMVEVLYANLLKNSPAV